MTSRRPVPYKPLIDDGGGAGAAGTGTEVLVTDCREVELAVAVPGVTWVVWLTGSVLRLCVVSDEFFELCFWHA